MTTKLLELCDDDLVDLDDCLPPTCVDEDSSGAVQLAWERDVEQYLDHLLIDVLFLGQPYGAQHIFSLILEHERRRPQRPIYFYVLASYLITDTIDEDKMSEDHVATLSHLYALVRQEGIDRDGPEGYLDAYVILDRHRCRITLLCELDDLVRPGYHCVNNVVIPDANYLAPGTISTLAVYGREYTRRLRSCAFLSCLDAQHAVYRLALGHTYPGHCAIRDFPSSCVRSINVYPFCDLLAAALPPVVSSLNDRAALEESIWWKEIGAEMVPSLVDALHEVILVSDRIPEVIRARLAVSLGEMDSFAPAVPRQSLQLAETRWNTIILKQLPDHPGARELCRAIVEDAASAFTGEALNEIAEGIVDLVVRRQECEGRVPALSDTYDIFGRAATLDIEAQQGHQGGIDASSALFGRAILRKLQEHLVRPGYHVVHDMVVPNPHWQGPATVGELADYGHAYMGWIRLWTFIGHLASLSSYGGTLPKHDFPGHYVLAHFSSARLRRAAIHKGHHTELDMFLAAMVPVLCLMPLTSSVVPDDRSRAGLKMFADLRDVLKDIVRVDDVPEATRARLAVITEDLNGPDWLAVADE